MGGREARSRGRDLPNAVLVRVLFDVSDMGSKLGGCANMLQMDVRVYLGVRGRCEPGSVKQRGRDEQFVPRYVGIRIYDGCCPVAECSWRWVVIHWVCGACGCNGAAHRSCLAQGCLLAGAVRLNTWDMFCLYI